MGYSNLTYEEFQNNIDYWKGDKGIELPQWADEIAERGGIGTSAIDFYDDLFGENLQCDKEESGEYEQAKYSAIALEIIQYTKNNKNGEEKQAYYGRKYMIKREQTKLYDLIDRSENFCMMSPISYIGYSSKNVNAREMYALCIEVDGIKGNSGLEELFYAWNRKNLRIPEPTYIVCSGNGLHLYYFFENPLPLYKNISEKLKAIRTYIIHILWNKYVTTEYEKIQYERVTQSFRLVGSVTKSRKSYAMAFKIGKKYTIESFNELLPKDLKLDSVYKSSTPLSESRELYPEWYQKRIVEKTPRGHYNRHKGIYYNWIKKVYEGAEVGRRYNCLENLCSLAVQCNIEPEQVEKDCRELALYLETLTTSEDNHFTEHDILSALKTYHFADENAYRRKIEVISQKSGIPLTPNKRNGRNQSLHLKLARANRDILCAERGKKDWREGNGRPSQRAKIKAFLENNPNARKCDVIKGTGLSKPTVYKYYDDIKNELRMGKC